MKSRVGRVGLVAVASVGLWALSGWLLSIYLRRVVANEYATGARVSTDGDSIGLPVGTFLAVFGFVLAVVNLAHLAWHVAASRRRFAARAT